MTMAFLLIGLLLVVGLLLCMTRDRQKYWSRRAIACPAQMKLFTGVLDKLGDFDYPDVLRFRDWTRQLGKTYGIQKGWTNILITSDPRLIHEMNQKFEMFHERERLPMRANVDSEKVIHVFRARGERWKRLRSLIQPIFAIRNLKRLLPIIEDSAWHMANLLGEEAAKSYEINMHSFSKEYSMDVISRLVMGQRESLQFKSDQSLILHETLNDNRAWLSYISWICPLLGPFCYKIRMLQSRLRGKGISVLMDRINSAIDERKKDRAAGKHNENPDFIDFFLDAESGQGSLTQKQLTAGEVAAQLKFFSIAGFDTVSNTLALVLFYLAKHSAVQDRVREEMEEFCGGNTILYEDLKRLKFCEAVMKEVLRLCPIATNSYGRTCTKDCTLNGLQIESGTIILTDLFSLHTDPELWGPDAADFVTERWLEGNIPQHAYFPFGGGPRHCLGMNLAQMELKLALVHILRRFRILETANTGEAPVLVSNTVLNVPKVLVHLEQI